MNLSRCSRALVAALLLVSVVAGTVAAVNDEAEGVPSDARVGSEVTATYTFTDLYSDYESWTLHGETNLTDVTWTVRELDQAGNQVDQNSYDGASFDEDVSLDSDTATVEVKVTGTVPAVENFTYDPPQRFRFASFAQTRQGGASEQITEDRVHHYTNESKQAREAIDEAAAAVEGSGSGDAQNALNNAIAAYDKSNFELARDLASEAENKASQSKQTQMLLFGGLGVVALALVVGGVYYWRQQRDTYDKLR